MRFFRDMLHNDLDGKKTALQRGPVGLLSLLPKEFTSEQVRELRMAQGMKPDPKDMLKNWLKRGHIEYLSDRSVYAKVGSGSINMRCL